MLNLVFPAIKQKKVRLDFKTFTYSLNATSSLNRRVGIVISVPIFFWPADLILRLTCLDQLVDLLNQLDEIQKVDFVFNKALKRFHIVIP